MPHPAKKRLFLAIILPHSDPFSYFPLNWVRIGSVGYADQVSIVLGVVNIKYSV